MKNQRLLNLKGLICIGIVAIAAFGSIPLTLTGQVAYLKSRGIYQADRWERYLPYGIEVGVNAAIASTVSVLLASLFIPNQLGVEIRKRALDKALRERLGKSDPLSDDQLEILSELLNESEDAKNQQIN